MSKILKEYIESILREEFFTYGSLGRFMKGSRNTTSSPFLRTLRTVFSKGYDAEDVVNQWIKSQEEKIGTKFKDDLKKEIRDFADEIGERIAKYSDGDPDEAESLLHRALKSKFNKKIRQIDVNEVAGNYSMTGLRRMQAPGNTRSGFLVRGNRDSIEHDAAEDSQIASQDVDSLPQSSVVFITRGGKVLAVSLGDNLSDMNMPGGGVEPGENPQDAAVRELWEETGLRAEKMVPLFSKVLNGKKVSFFRVTEFSGKLRSSHEGTASWEDPEVLLRSSYGGSLRDVLLTLRGDAMSKR